MRQSVAFHKAFALPMNPLPTTHVDGITAQFRIDLLLEEVNEFAEATHERDLIKLADALGDIVYAAYGAAVTYGIDLDDVLAEVHRSNMSKLDKNGVPLKRPDGKVIKSALYSRPDLGPVLENQAPLYEADVSDRLDP